MGKMCYFIDILLRCNELTLYDGIWAQNRVKTARKRLKLQKMPKNDLPGLLPVSALWRKNFFGLSCLVISVGNKVSFKIYSNQANR